MTAEQELDVTRVRTILAGMGWTIKSLEYKENETVITISKKYEKTE